MVKTFKYKSWVFTIAAGLVSFIAALNIEQVESVLPMEYSYLAPLILYIAIFLTNQWSEEKRVKTAEELILEKQNEIMGTPLTNDEYIETQEGIDDTR